MRTTLTIDDDLIARLKEVAHERHLPLKRVVNDAIRGGLDRPRDRVPFVQETFNLGRAKLDLTKAGQVASQLENEELVRKLGESS